MRTARLLGLVVVGLMLSSTLPLLAADPAPTPATLSPPAVTDTITLEDLFGVQSAAVDSPFLATSWSCPAYTQICTTSSQCDAYCGGVGWGECISFGGVRKCCACNT
jgi:hypothetical protein